MGLEDYRGQTRYSVPSNRAPLWIDGTLTQAQTTGIVSAYGDTAANTFTTGTSTLLKTSTAKLIQVKDYTGTFNWLAQAVTITNSSGQACTISLVVARGGFTRPGVAAVTSTTSSSQGSITNTTQGQGDPFVFEQMLFPIPLASAATITINNVRIFQIIETNGAGGNQGSTGTSYLFTLENLTL